MSSNHLAQTRSRSRKRRLRLGRERVEAACSRALDIDARTYGSVKSILDNGLDRLPSARAATGQPVDHSNIRGPRYYH